MAYLVSWAFGVVNLLRWDLDWDDDLEDVSGNFKGICVYILRINETEVVGRMHPEAQGRNQNEKEIQS